MATENIHFPFFSPLCIAISALLLTSPVNSIRQFNFYQKYYIEDVCASNQSIVYIVDSSGLSSSVKISASRYPWIKNHLNCSITIRPPIHHGIILAFDSIAFGYSSTLQKCTDYIQVIGDKGDSTEICGHDIPEQFISEGEISMVYHTGDDYLRIMGFTIVATAYSHANGRSCKDETFLCKARYCIWEKLICDGINNCGDNSDEDWLGISQCHDIPDFTARPIDINWKINPPTLSGNTDQAQMTTMTTAIFCLLFVLMTALTRVYCYRWNQRYNRALEGQLSLIRDRVDVRPLHEGNSRPPPYSILGMVSYATEQMHDCRPPPYAVILDRVSKDVQATTSFRPTAETDNSNEQLQERNLESRPEPLFDVPPPYSPSNNI